MSAYYSDSQIKQEMEWQIKRESLQPPVRVSLAIAETAKLATGQGTLGHLVRLPVRYLKFGMRTEWGVRGPVVFANFQ